MIERENDKSGTEKAEFSFKKALEDFEAPSSDSFDLGPQIGYAREPKAREVKIPAGGDIQIGMNSAGYATVGPGESVEMFTKSLTGCTGIAGIASGPEGSVLGLSHFATMVDRLQRIHSGGAGGEVGSSPSLQFLYDYAHTAHEAGASSTDLVVAYDQTIEHDPDYHAKEGSYYSWHFLDQLEVAAEQLKKQGVNVRFLPYQNGEGHTLTVSTQRQEGVTGITFNGEPIEASPAGPDSSQ